MEEGHRYASEGWNPFQLAASSFGAMSAASFWPLAGFLGMAEAISRPMREQQALATLLDEASTLAATAAGPVEYAPQGEGMPVLVAHGIGGGYDQGLFFTELLREPGFRYLAISRPGYLRTPLRVGASPATQADAFAALLDHLGLACAAVLGISAGGPSALQFALRHPDRCSAVVLLSAGSQRLLLEGSPFYIWMKRLVFNDVNMRWILKVIEDKPEHSVRYHVSDPAMQEAILADPRLVELFVEFYRVMYPASLRWNGVDNDIEHLTTLPDAPLERITAPTLVVHGTGDRTAPLAHALAVAARVPGAKLATIEGGEHLCAITHQAQVKGTIGAFLRAIRTGEDRESAVDTAWPVAPRRRSGRRLAT